MLHTFQNFTQPTKNITVAQFWAATHQKHNRDPVLGRNPQFGKLWVRLLNKLMVLIYAYKKLLWHYKIH